MAENVDVFVAHAGEDQDVALVLRDALHEQGYSVFVYQENREVEPHFKTTDRVLNTGQPVVVLIASEAAADSPHVQREASIAVYRKLPTVVVYRRLDPGRLSGRVRINLGLMGGENGTVVEDAPAPEHLSRIVEMVGTARTSAQPAARARPDVVGREDDLERLLDLLEKDERPVVNVHGAPGAGKSTIATWLGEEARRRSIVDDVAVVRLDREQRNPSEIAQLVASALDLDTDGKADPAVTEVIGGELARRGALLLQIENIEQVTVSTERMLVEWGSMAPGLRILTTSSRTYLEPNPRVCEYPLPPLSLPAGDIDTADPESLIEGSAAIRLFLSLLPDIDIARPRVRKALEGDPEVIRDVARLCVVLGGFPYPIRLAAKPFSIKGGDLKKLIRHNEEFLRAHPDEPDDRQYMFAATKTQLELLPARARLGFLQCAQFEGPIGDDAADEILLHAQGGSSASQTLDQLTEYHLLEFDDGDERYTLSLPIKQYGRFAWEAETTPEDRAAHEERFTRYFAELARAAIDDDADEDDRREARAAVDLDRINLLQAARLLPAGDERLAEVVLAVARSLLVHGPAHDLHELVPAALEVVPPARPELRVRLLSAQAEAAWSFGAYEEAVGLAEEAVAAAGAVDDDQVEAHALMSLGKHLGYVGRRPEERITMMRSAIERLEARPEQVEELIGALLTLVGQLDVRGEVEEAEQFVEQARRLAEEHLGTDDWWLGRVHNSHGLLHWHDGRPAEALESLREAERIFRACDSELWQGATLTNQVFVLTDLAQDRLDEALHICETAQVKILHTKNRLWALVHSAAWAGALFFKGKRREAIDMLESTSGDRAGDEYAENRALVACILGEAYREERDDRARETLTGAIDLLDTTGGSLLLRRFRVGVALADLLGEKGERAEARCQLEALDQVRKVRRLTRRNEVSVWHLRDACTRYLELKDELLDDER